jgi:serine/threonine protein kinase
LRKERFGDYELLEEIARGGMGVVFKARQISLDRIVAVKMILAGQFVGAREAQRFRMEAQIAAQLQHPNIVAIYEIGAEQGRLFFSMEFVEGMDLAKLVEGSALEPRQAAYYVKLIAEAVHYAHQKGVLHRDLKPSNVLIDNSGRPRVTDFGLAKETARDANLTLTGQVLGTPSFMPPEQAAGRREVTGPFNDVYSLGALMYFLLTGSPPFSGETLQETLLAVQRQEPKSPRVLDSNIPRDLETICLKCMEKDPRRRYMSAQALADELGRFLTGEPILARPITKVERLSRWCRRSPAIASLAVSLILSLIGLLVMVVFRPVIYKLSFRSPEMMEAPSGLFEIDGSSMAWAEIASAKGCAVDANNNRIWTATFGYGGVAAFDCKTYEMVAHIPLDHFPIGVYLDPVRQVLWVGAQGGKPHGNDPLWAIDARHFKTIKGPISSGQIWGDDAVVNPVTGRLYFSGGGISKRIDPVTFALKTNAFLPVLAVDPSINLLYASKGDGRFQIIDGVADAETVLTNLNLLFPITRVEADTNSHRLFSGNFYTNSILVLDGRTGQVLDQFALEAKMGKVKVIWGLAYDSLRACLWATASTETSAYCLYRIKDGVQTAIVIPTNCGRPVLNTGLNKIYIWASHLSQGVN